MSGFKSLKFAANEPMDLPGTPSTSSISDRRHYKNSRHTIEFIPQMRSFLVTYHRPEAEADRMLIHESVPQAVILGSGE